MDSHIRPVISVVVVTYNSSIYVKETLDSIFNQDYDGPIELIISDDNSTDDTIEVCKQWLSEYQDRFVNKKIIRTPKNLGICGNYNFALNAISGEWVKYIAGDDILMPNALSYYMHMVSQTGDKAFCGAVITFNDNPRLDVENAQYGYRLLAERLLDDSDPDVQHYNLLFAHGYGIVEGPSLFIHVQSLRDLGGMDERYPMLEDMTFALNWTKTGRHLGVIKKPLVKYREYTESVSKKFKLMYFQKMTYRALYSARSDFYWRRKKYLKSWNWYLMKTILKYDQPTLKDKILKIMILLLNIQMYVDKVKWIYSKITL